MAKKCCLFFSKSEILKIKSVVYYFLKISRNRPGVFIEGPENLSKSTPKTKKMAPSARSLKTCLFIPLNAFYTSGNQLLYPLKYQKISPAAGCTPRKINFCILSKYLFSYVTGCTPRKINFCIIKTYFRMWRAVHLGKLTFVPKKKTKKHMR